MFFAPYTGNKMAEKCAAFFEFLLARVGRNIMIYIYIYVIPIGEYIL